MHTVKQYILNTIIIQICHLVKIDQRIIFEKFDVEKKYLLEYEKVLVQFENKYLDFGVEFNFKFTHKISLRLPHIIIKT